jgi:hypothetical protein
MLGISGEWKKHQCLTSILLGLCLKMGADVSLEVDEAGLPLLAVPH